MNTESNLSNSELRKALAVDIRDAETIDDLARVLKSIEAKENHENAKASLVLDLYCRLKRLTSRDSERAHDFIVGGLLDWCCKPSGDGLSVSKMQSHELRDLLKKWVYQYSFEDCSPIRNSILDKLYKRIDKQPANELLWLLAAIGLRTKEAVRRLERLLDGADKDLSDTALFVLARLGVPLEKRSKILSSVTDQLANNKIKDQRGTIVALEELSSPSHPALSKELLRVAEKELDEKEIDFALCFGAASRVAERQPKNTELHQAIWSVFKRFWRTMRMTPSYANSCNIPETLKDYVDSLINENGENPTAGDYITLSRISELVSPNHLSGWNQIDLNKLAPVLKELATLDTKIEGRFTTTSLRLKTEAWHLALTARIPDVDQWIDAAILDETNPDCARQVAAIIACVQPATLSTRFLNEIQQEPVGKEWTRHLGLIEIARSCSNEQCLDALLNFGLTKDGHVLLSTLNAIIDCALAQARAGNKLAVQKVLDKTHVTCKKRHREAAIGAFCELSTEKGIVSRADLNRLWDFANDETLDEYSRKSAYGAISVSGAEVSRDQLAKLVEFGKEEGELSWRACEVLVKRNLVDLKQDEWLQKKLRLKHQHEKLAFSSDEEIPIWQAYLIGHSFLREPSFYSELISLLISSCSEKSLYQLFYPLEEIGHLCPENVSMALAQRIQKSNSSARTNVELFRILRIVSPSKLFALAKLSEWKEWLPVARAAFADNIGKAAAQDSRLSGEAATLLLAFTRDAAYQVRRTAYRALASAEKARLRNQCEVWSLTANVEYRKRGAEAISWLTSDSYPDPSITRFGFDWDPERVVRETCKGTTPRRWRLALARKYVEALQGECLKKSGVGEAYRYARALEKLGDDETADQIREFMSQNILSSYSGHMLAQTEKAIRNNWKKETRKWPEPWAHETGIVEQANGQLIVDGKDPFEAFFTLTCDHQKSPSDLGEWNATAIIEGGPSVVGFQLPDSPVTIKIKNRCDAKAYVFGLDWIENNSKAVFNLGGGLTDYPAEAIAKVSEPVSLHEDVRKAIASSHVRLRHGLDGAEQLIGEVVEKAELDFFDPRGAADPQSISKLACQVTAVVLASIVDLFENEEATSIFLWQVCNEILGRKSLALRLIPQEANSLQLVARKSDVAAPDELLFWLIERVVDFEVDSKNTSVRTQD